MSKLILDLCGGSGSWSLPYKENGYEVTLVTLPEMDVRFFNPPDDVYGILAAPPCTEFSIARNNKPRNFEKGLEVVYACIRIINMCNAKKKLKFFAIENPVGHLRRFLGEPDFRFQPWHFGDAWTKRTCLWGRFNPPQRKYRSFTELEPIPGLYIQPGRRTPSLALGDHNLKVPQLEPFRDYVYSVSSYHNERRASWRAITPPGFAHAFYEANK